jgi:16S rRNA (cytidine1402-2'-O)-methyltransferase
MPGTLFVVATPIGNLEDLTFRALRTLREVDLIAAEDTRRTSRLLARYEVRKPLVSLREHNEARESPRLLERLRAGESIALVSDAGTPGISDPGGRLVRAAREADLPVVPIPGPSAITAALSSSGVPADEFVFMGFPPSSGKAREEWLERLANEPRTVVFFESPHRIRRTLTDVAVVKQPIYVHRELSKIHEHFVIWPMQRPSAQLPATGEFTVVVPPQQRPAATPNENQVFELFSSLVQGAPIDRHTALRLTALAQGVSERAVAKIVKKHIILAKQQNGSPT